MKMSKLFQTSALIISAAVLSACGGGGNSNVTPVTPVVVDPPAPVAQTPQEQAGAGFNQAFNADKFAEPIDPVAGDVNALDKRAEPIDIPNP